MSRRPRRNHTPAFKAKVAIAAVKGDRTVVQLAEQLDIHPNQISIRDITQDAAGNDAGRRSLAPIAGVLRWCRKQLRAAPGEPIDREADPFVHGSVGSPQPVAYGRNWAQHILGATCAPVDRIGLNRKAHLAEDTDCSGHMIG